MQRQFTASDLVALPRLKARELLAIARALVLHARKVGGMADHVAEALRDVEAQTAPLATELGPPEPRSGVTYKDADRAEVNAMGALVDFVTAWTRLPEDEFPSQVAVGRECLDVLLEGAGLEFLTYKPLVKHSEVQRRLDNLDAHKLDDALRDLGGEAFLKHMMKAHKAYGAVSGATAKPAEADSPAVRAKAAELADAVKTYVVRAVGTVDRKRPETRDHVDSLLHPLRSWATPTAGAADTTTDDNAGDGHVTTPVTPAAPVHNAAPANDATPAPARKTG